MPSNDNKPNHDPWGRRPEEGPPDLIALIKKFFKSKPNNNAPGEQPPVSSIPLNFIGLGALAVVALWVISGIFIVSPAERAVVQRFGRYIETLNSGPHWIPRFIDTQNTINIEQIKTFPYEAEMLTKDENIVYVKIAVQYRVENPRDYLFNVVDPTVTFQQAASSTLRQVVGQSTLNSVLTKGKQALRDQVAVQLNETLALYNTGIKVMDVTLQEVKPPEAVREAFDDAINAREDQQRYINIADAYKSKQLETANGEIARIAKSAEAYKQSVVLDAKGNTARYLALLKPYNEAPNVTRERLYLDTLSEVLAQTSNIIVDSKGNNVLYLPLDQILRQQMHKQAVTNDSASAQEGDAKLSTPNTDTTPSDNSTRPSYSALGDN